MDWFSFFACWVDPIRYLAIFAVLAIYTETANFPNSKFAIILATSLSTVVAWFLFSAITSLMQPISIFIAGLVTSFIITILMMKKLFGDSFSTAKEQKAN